MSDVEESEKDQNMSRMSESDDSEELEEPEELNHEDAPSIPDNAVQQSVQIHSDKEEDLFSEPLSGCDEDDAYDEANDSFANLAGGSHKRGRSMTEKRESIQQQKAAMEAKLRTLSQNLDLGMDAAMDEFTEMDQINEDKSIFGDLFDKIDPDNNGDVDEREFIQGMLRLNVQIMENDMSKLFKLMDGDKSGYIDRQDWINFCMTNYQSRELQRIHDSVLASVKGHSRKPSNMFHAGDSENWSASAITVLEKQMTQAFLKQGADEMVKTEEEEEYFVSMEKEAESNPQWAKPERALEWTPKEVAFWLDTIELGQYARKFDNEQVDGSILLNDCDKNLLQREMTIKPLHVGKILREVDKLRKMNADELQDSYKDWNELINENQILLNALADKENAITELQTEIAELRLKSINQVTNMMDIANPMGDQAEKGDGDVLMTAGDTPTEDAELKTDTDPFVEIKMLNQEIEHLHRQKITFAENAATEIGKLNGIIKVLSREYTTLSTPYYKKFNPMDHIIRSLGYTPTQAQ
eukprot:16353_1